MREFQEQPEFLPSFTAHAESPSLARGQVGIVIAANKPEHQWDEWRWVLRGQLRLPLQAEHEHSPEEVLRRLVVTIQDGWNQDAASRFLLRDQVVFPEDVDAHSGHVQAYFNADLLALFSFEYARPYNPYFITISCGDVLSPSLHCDAPMPWLER